MNTIMTPRPSLPSPPPNVRRCVGKILALLLLAACAWILPAGAASAQDCNPTSPPNMNFGTVGPGGATTSGTLGFYCDNWSGSAQTYRVCVFVNPSNPTGVNPRRMVTWEVTPNAYLNFDIYADSALTKLVGAESSTDPVYSVTVSPPTGGQTNYSFPLYASLPPGQTVAAGNYISQNNIVLRFIYQAGNTAPSDMACTGGKVQSNYTTINATFANACYISAATDMDFGLATNLAITRDQTSAISLHCPNTIPWQVALGYGSNASGTTRRMLGPGSNYLTYQLYRNSERTQAWGNTAAEGMSGMGNNQTQTLTVYGRVPAQTVNAPGTYSDTVVITLTY